MSQREVIIILGKTGYGKSTWLRKYAAHIPRKFCFDVYAEFPAQYYSEQQLLEGHERGDFKNAEQFSIGTNKIQDFPLLGAISYETWRNCLIVEECGIAFYKGERIEEWLQEIIFGGRHREVSVILTAQRAASIPVDLRSQATRFISFRQTEKTDIKWTEQYLGERYTELLTLPYYCCLDAYRDSVSRYGGEGSGSQDTDLDNQEPPE